MAQAANNKKPFRLSHGPTQISAIAPQQAEKLRTNGVYYMDDQLVTIGTFVASNWGYIEFPIGRYTYRQWGFSLLATAAIAGVTTLRDGKHVVDTAKIPDYIDTFVIEINGAAKWEMTAAEFVKWNGYQNLDTSNGVLRWAFGAPNLHNTDAAEDAYQLGTANLRSLKLRVKTKSTWVNGMMPLINVEYAAVARNIGYFTTTTRAVFTNPSAGDYYNSDIAVGIDFATIWVQGASINRAKLTVDREQIFDCQNYQLRAMHEAWGKDVAALGDGIIFDSWRDGDAIGVDSVSDSVAERKRGADVRLDLNMAAAGVQMTCIVIHCGLFAQQ
ncbi:hypothetical protein OD754_10765 [Rhodobacter capsulatus]|uniref:major capsid protein P2 n=1 Tax=Rhodobacter capsulatus TaxID=1061 RepID=UPI0028743E01|nr:major capsid protein P2 [Rhodobacter capsulatus]MDS0927305.1 hypothetical protein [Rhodobacter capsulatus]UYE93258.1 hypothetical protein Jorvik_09 [Rhodobacter phage Jorvik]